MKKKKGGDSEHGTRENHRRLKSVESLKERRKRAKLKKTKQNKKKLEEIMIENSLSLLRQKH